MRSMGSKHPTPARVCPNNPDDCCLSDVCRAHPSVHTPGASCPSTAHQAAAGLQPPWCAEQGAQGQQGRSGNVPGPDAIIAHELRQPLFTIGMASENLRILSGRAEVDRDLLQKSIARIVEQVARAQAIIERTLATETHRSNSAETCNVMAAAEGALKFLGEMFVSFDVDAQCAGNANAARANVPLIEMEQIFVNLLKNALESICRRRDQGWRGQGRIVIAIEASGQDISCAVSDNGAGLCSAIHDARGAAHLFEAFAQDPAQKVEARVIGPGIGLGLHICKEIVGRAGGEIWLMPGKSEGAIAEVRLPLAG